MGLQIMCNVTLLKVYLKVRSHLTEPWILFEILHYILYNLSLQLMSTYESIVSTSLVLKFWSWTTDEDLNE